MCVLQGAGCWLTARPSSPASGLPATLRRGIGKQPAQAGPLLPGERGGRQGEGRWVAVGSTAWSKASAKLSREAEEQRRRSLQKTRLEHVAAAGGTLSPAGSGDPAELGSTPQHVAPLAESAFVCVPGSPSQAYVGAPEGFFGCAWDSRCFWAGLER